jgi:hypothetical protein
VVLGFEPKAAATAWMSRASCPQWLVRLILLLPCKRRERKRSLGGQTHPRAIAFDIALYRHRCPCA